MQDIKGKIAFITGGTKGIGFGIAKSFLRNGINVAITGRSQTSVDEAVRELNASGNDSTHAIGVAADVRKLDDMQQAVNKTVEALGRIDVVIANAGLGHFAPIQELTEAQWNETIDTNLTGAFFTLKASVDQLIENHGYFISISSLAGTNFFANGSAYNASKFGLTGFSQAVMLDLRKFGVKVTTIMPGSVSTYFNNNSPSKEDDWKIQIEDIGEMAVDLLKMHPRTLPSKIEVRPSVPPSS